MNGLSKIGTAFLVGSLTLLGAACGTSNTAAPAQPPKQEVPAAANPVAPTTPTQPAAPAAQPKQPPMKVISGQPARSFSSLAIYMALEKGFDKKHGIEIEIMHLRDDKLVTQGMLAGEVHVGVGNLSASLAAQASGVPQKVVGVTTVGAPWALAVRADRGINTLKDLYGKAVGISSPGGLPDTLVRALFEKEKLDPSKLTYAPAGGNSDRARALLAGKVDAAIISLNDIVMVQADPKVKILHRIPEALPEYVASAIFVADKTIQEKPLIPQGYILAQMEGARYVVEHRDEAIALAAKLLEQKPEDLAPIYDQYRATWAVNGHASRESVDYMQKLNLKLKAQDKELPMEQAVTWQFTEEALKRLGTFQIR